MYLKLAKEEKVDAILAAGDLFEFPSVSPGVTDAVAQVLQRHREVPIHAISRFVRSKFGLEHSRVS